MTEQRRWHELYRTDDFSRVRSVLMTIASMEFEVRCLDGTGREMKLGDKSEVRGPYSIHVPPEHALELGEVIEEIIAEQEEFDALLDDQNRLDRRARRRLILLMVIIVTVLAALGLIDL